MKVTITSTKAPWPEGAKVGDVVQFSGKVAPAWALGKFSPAEDNAKVDHKYVAPEPQSGEPGPVLESIGAVNLEVAELQQQNAALQARVAELEAAASQTDDAKAAAAIAASDKQAAEEKAAADAKAKGKAK